MPPHLTRQHGLAGNQIDVDAIATHFTLLGQQPDRCIGMGGAPPVVDLHVRREQLLQPPLLRPQLKSDGLIEGQHTIALDPVAALGLCLPALR